MEGLHINTISSNTEPKKNVLMFYVHALAFSSS